VNHTKALAILLGVFVVLPVLLFFTLRWLARYLLNTRPISETATEIENPGCIVPMTSPVRTCVAVAICASSAVLGAMAIHQGWGSVSSIAFNVSCPWFLAGSWLAGDFTREGWKRLNNPLSKIYQDFKNHRVAKVPWLARLMNGGGGVMVLAGILALVTSSDH
jgi:HAMP domain-containing protein